MGGGIFVLVSPSLHNTHYFLTVHFLIKKFCNLNFYHYICEPDCCGNNNIKNRFIMKHFLQNNREGGIKLETINRVLSSNTNFVKRLKQSGRSLIPDWASNSIATHKLGVGTDDYGHFIYPGVQEINGRLIDFTRPPYHNFAGQDSAIDRGDIVRFGNTDNDLQDAIEFTERYKSLPQLPKFQKGGDVKQGLIPIPEWAKTHSNIVPYGYKKYEGDDLNNLETFNRNWYKYRDEQLYNEFYPYSYAESRLRGEIDFPFFKGKRGVDKNTFVEGVKKHINNRLDSVDEWTVSDAIKDPVMRETLKRRFLRQVKVDNPDSLSDKDLKLMNYLQKGVYYSGSHQILYSDRYENSSTKIHERTHAIKFPLGFGIRLLPGVEKNRYYDNSGEIRSRLMQMRFENYLDPTHKYNLHEIRNMRGDKEFKDFNIFERYDDNTIEFLLNKIANNYKSKNNTNMQNSIG